MANLRIRTRLLLVLAIPLVGIAALIWYERLTLSEVQVNGPLYEESIEANDVVADVLPPPQYLVETILQTEQLADATDPDEIAELIVELGERRDEYDERHAFWQDSHLPEEHPQVAVPLLEDSFLPAQRYYEVLEASFVPAIERGDRDEARRILDEELTPLYDEHRLAIDEVVRQARALVEEVEAETAATLESRTGTSLLIIGAILAAVLVLGALVVRSITSPLRRLEHRLPAIAEELRTADLAVGAPEVEEIDLGSRDELGQTTAAFNSVVGTAVGLAAEQAAVRQNLADTLQHLGRRNQNLLRRMMNFITELEQDERDAETLEHLFRLDHLATRMRRNAESLLVLAGAEQPRRWAEAVPVGDVARSAVSEIEDYQRVDIVNLEPVVVQGAAAADLSHLLAELVENATAFSPPSTRVTINGRRVAEGYLVAVTDTGLGLDEEALTQANARIAEAAARPTELTDSKLLGLNVVGRLAERHGIRVELRANPGGGVVALVLLPRPIVAKMPSVEGFTAADTDAARPAAAAPTSDPRLDVPASLPAPDEPIPTDPRPGGDAGATAPGDPLSGGPRPQGPATGPTSDGSLRRRVRSGEHVPRTQPPPGHGPVRSADEVRSSWSRLEAGVRQARRERNQNRQEGNRPS